MSTHAYVRLNDSVAVLLVFFALVLLVCGLGYWSGPKFANEAQQLWNQVSGSLGNLEKLFGFGGQGGGSGTTGAVGGIANAATGGGETSMVTGLAKTVATSITSLLAAILVILATGVYLALAPDMYINGVAHLTPVCLLRFSIYLDC